MRLQRIAVWIAAVALATTLLGVLIRAYRQQDDRMRERTTFRNIFALGEAIERTAGSPGFVCARRLKDLPAAVTQQLKPEQLRDGWGHELLVIWGASRYVIIGTGADGRRDVSWKERAFTDPSGDMIFSNGEWLRHEMGFATAPGLPPRPEDALREAGICDPATGVPGTWCYFYLYLPSERAAQEAANDVVTLGYEVHVFRSARPPDWLCVARKKSPWSVEFLPELWRVAKNHGG